MHSLMTMDALAFLCQSWTRMSLESGSAGGLFSWSNNFLFKRSDNKSSDRRLLHAFGALPPVISTSSCGVWP